MNRMMMVAFMDELTKIAASSPEGSAQSNFAAPLGLKSGMGSNTMVSLSPSKGSMAGTPKMSPGKTNISAKPTNYSIVHSESPSAAFGSTASTSKAVPPPPVRT